MTGEDDDFEVVIQRNFLKKTGHKVNENALSDSDSKEETTKQPQVGV